jgi:hypothetical protein
MALRMASNTVMPAQAAAMETTAAAEKTAEAAALEAATKMIERWWRQLR